MSYGVRLYGDKIDLADQLLEEFHADAKGAVEEASSIVLPEVERLLTLRRGTKATAAPEGEPPEADTTALLRSWKVMTPRVGQNRYGEATVRGGIESNDPGVPRLEFGVTDVRGVRTLPHPFVLPAFATKRDEMDAAIRARLT